MDVGVAALPRFKQPHTVSWASCNEISATTANVDAMFDFFRWFCESKTNPRQIVSNFPNSVEYYQHPEFRPNGSATRSSAPITSRSFLLTSLAI